MGYEPAEKGEHTGEQVREASPRGRRRRAERRSQQHRWLQWIRISRLRRWLQWIRISRLRRFLVLLTPDAFRLIGLLLCLIKAIKAQHLLLALLAYIPVQSDHSPWPTVLDVGRRCLLPFAFRANPSEFKRQINTSEKYNAMDDFVAYASSWPPNGQLHLLAGTALILGLGKGGVPGLATIATAATVITAPSHIGGGLGYAVALQVPILTMIDVYAAWLHQSVLEWTTVWLLLPTSFLGMALGQIADRYLSDRGARLLVGCILLGILILRTWKDVATYLCPSWAIQHKLRSKKRSERQRRQQNKDSDDESDPEDKQSPSSLDIEHGGRGLEKLPVSIKPQRHSFGWACLVGLIGGAATMLTNSMGPILNVYLLSVAELSPQAYIGTRAIFFCFLNIGKLPLRILGGTLGITMLPIAAGLGVISVIGVFLAKPIMLSMNEATFTRLELAVVAFAGFRLCFLGLQ